AGTSRCATTRMPRAPTPRTTPRCSATCSSAGSTWRRRSSSACSSRSRTATRRSTGRSRPLATSSATDVWEALAAEAAAESPLWGEALRPSGEQERVAVFSTLCEERYALGVESIYEGYLLHYGRPRLFAPADPDTALLLGDYLYAHGLVRIAATGNVEAVRDLAELISLCAQARADGAGGDGVAWAATAALLGSGDLEPARAALRDERDPAPLERLARDAAGDAAVERSLAAHA